MTPTDLVCMRISDMVVMHPKQITRECHQCHQPVGVYPTGQRIMRLHPRIKLICTVCAALTPQQLIEEAFPAGSMEEIRQEKLESEPVPGQHNDHVWIVSGGKSWAIWGMHGSLLSLWRGYYPSIEYSILDISQVNWDTYYEHWLSMQRQEFGWVPKKEKP